MILFYWHTPLIWVHIQSKATRIPVKHGAFSRCLIVRVYLQSSVLVFYSTSIHPQAMKTASYDRNKEPTQS